jgi:hypothetical protein
MKGELTVLASAGGKKICLFRLLFYPEDGDSTLIRSVGKQPREMASHPQKAVLFTVIVARNDFSN